MSWQMRWRTNPGFARVSHLDGDLPWSTAAGPRIERLRRPATNPGAERLSPSAGK
jgi:hypothetical protein